MGQTIKQLIFFKASPHELFELLMDEKKHAAFTGADCEISLEVGGQFSCYDGYITGENLVIEEDKKIVQKWRGKEWPEGHFSEATFEFTEIGSGGTQLSLTQTDVPDEEAKHIERGWHDHYWDKMKKYLGE